ncbi:hypothetical protein AUC70_11860 [Methyloceanibacter stevinii]|uniref:DNA transposition protein n=1 Tax=Methyloceanibacter stevinii TaxID=1774970 RepID=A0A1E3VJU7_9HYPH|nr:AAA family ATPase [Methyloceanibacter stevinii]ODR93551.1 hypothetical protein AUC70_11860 [Methyloceanibacter stevinii]
MSANETQATELQPGWAEPRFEPDGLSSQELQRWRALTTRVADVARRHGWTKAEVSRRADVKASKLSQWYDGNYKGTIRNVNDDIETWLDSLHEDSATEALIPQQPGFVETPTSARIRDILLYAQLSPEIVIVTAGAGMGKTMTAQHLQKTRPHVHMVTMRPSTKTAHGMMNEFRVALDVPEKNPANLDRALGDKLRRNGRKTLLIVDEAQHLLDDAVNQLRYFFDQFGVGLALMGNEDVFTRFSIAKGKANQAQIHRRVGMRFRRMDPTAGDVAAIVDAWGITDEAIVKLCRGIGMKPGALSQISKTLQLAWMYAAGERRELAAADVRRAWEERGGEL